MEYNDLEDMHKMDFLKRLYRLLTFSSILPTYATMGAQEEGMEIYQRVVENGTLVSKK